MVILYFVLKLRLKQLLKVKSRFSKVESILFLEYNHYIIWVME